MTHSPASEWSSAFLGELIARGVTDFVVSPGSRSQSLALAALEWERASEGLITVHVVIDERSAGFRALGLALESTQASCVYCDIWFSSPALHASACRSPACGGAHDGHFSRSSQRTPGSRGESNNRSKRALWRYRSNLECRGTGGRSSTGSWSASSGNAERSTRGSSCSPQCGLSRASQRYCRYASGDAPGSSPSLRGS